MTSLTFKHTPNEFFPEFDDFPHKKQGICQCWAVLSSAFRSQIGFQTSFHNESQLVSDLVKASLKTRPTILTQVRTGLLIILFKFFLKTTIRNLVHFKYHFICTFKGQ
jgi:hypothetical protein